MARKTFLEMARERVVVLDGAMGSNLQTRPLDLAREIERYGATTPGGIGVSVRG